MVYIQQLPAHEQAILRQELDASESVQWIGRPIPRKVLIRSLGIYLFAVPWTAFSLFWESIALSMLFGGMTPESGPVPWGMRIVFPLFGLPFVLIGVWLMSTPFYVAHKAKHTLYVVTSKRALIVSGGRKRNVESFPLTTLGQQIERKDSGDGSGSLYFHFRTGYDSDGDRTVNKKGFEHTTDVRGAEAKLKEALARTEALRSS